LIYLRRNYLIPQVRPNQKQRKGITEITVL
jgi:hypothetical protein